MCGVLLMWSFQKCDVRWMVRHHLRYDYSVKRNQKIHQLVARFSGTQDEIIDAVTDQLWGLLTGHQLTIPTFDSAVDTILNGDQS